MLVISGYIEDIKSNIDENEVKNVVYTSDIINYYTRSIQAINILSEILQESFVNDRGICFNNSSNYSVVNVNEDYTFMGNTGDDIIGEMIFSKETFSLEAINTFDELVKKYYGEPKCMLELGCNIGTTFVHMLSINKEMIAYAFEADPNTAFLAKMNSFLNDVDGRVTVINKGIGNCASPMKIKKLRFASGVNYIVTNVDDIKDELDEVDVIPIDLWIEENDIDMSLIDCIWMDIQGFEGYALEGMLKLLENHKVALYTEFVPDLLVESKSYDVFIEIVSKIYNGFLMVNDDGECSNLYSITKLKELKNVNTNLFFI